MTRDVNDIRAQVDAARQHIAGATAWAAEASGPAKVGELYTFAATASLGVEWLAVLQNVDDEGLLYLVPFDQNSMVGTWDVSVSEFSTSGEGTLRCGRGFWLHVDDFASAKRSALIEPAIVDAARAKLDQMVTGDRVAESGFEIDDDPDYRQWIDEISAAADQLEAQLKRPAETGQSPDIISIMQFDRGWVSEPGIRSRQVRPLAADSDGLVAGPSEEAGVPPGRVLATGMPGTLVVMLESMGLRLHYHPSDREDGPSVGVDGVAVQWRTLPDGIIESLQLISLGQSVSVELPAGDIVTLSSDV